MKAEIKLTVTEVEKILKDYVAKQTGSTPSAIRFDIGQVTEGDQRDSWVVTKLKEAVVTVDLLNK
jgi:hypothetical protein